MLDQVLDSLVIRTLGFVVLYALILWLAGRIRFYRLSWKLDGPLGLPIFGNMAPQAVAIQPYDSLNRLVNKYTAPVRLWIGMDFALMISEPEDFESLIYNKCLIRKSTENDLLMSMMDEGVSTGTGIEWNINREVSDLGFTCHMLKAYQPYYNKYSGILVKNLSKECNSGLVDINMHILRYSADIICDTLFEEKFNFYSGEHDDVLLIPSSILGSLAERKGVHNPFFEFDPKKLRKHFTSQLDRHRSFFHVALDKKINNYILTKKTENVYDIENFEKSELYKKSKGQSVFEEMMLRMCSAMMVRKQIIDNFDNVYLVGVDIVATQLSLFILMMGLYKNIQGVLYDEISKYYKDNVDTEVRREDFSHLPYLDMCVKEVMRLFPSLIMSPRTTLHDVPMKNRDLVVPAKTVVLFNYYALHRNPKYWDNPDEFRPERFRQEEDEKRPKYAYLPLGSGPRDCLGKSFGVDMMKTGIIYMMRKYEFGTDSNFGYLRVKNDVRVRSAQGYNVLIKERS